MLTKREEKIVRLIVNGSMRKRRIFVLIFFFLITIYGSISLVLRSNAQFAIIKNKMKATNHAISNMQATTANEIDLKEKLLVQTDKMNMVISTFLFVTTWSIVSLYCFLFLLAILLFWTHSIKNNIIKKLVDLTGFKLDN